MNYLLDTCVISEPASRKPNATVMAWLDSVPETSLYLSVITIGEVKKGVERLPQSERKTALVNWLQDGLLVRFAGRMLPIDAGVALEWGELASQMAAAGRNLPAMDSLIAATARYHDLVLVTRNEGDFAGTGVRLLNPWR